MNLDRTSSTSTLALGNAHLVDSTKTALGAVFHLDDMGCTVREIEVRQRRPVIRIDPPPGHCWLRGAMCRRVTERGVTRVVFVTVCHGAQVEWEVSEHRTPEVAQA